MPADMMERMPLRVGRREPNGLMGGDGREDDRG
jgi:hypothetical protein